MLTKLYDLKHYFRKFKSTNFYSGSVWIITITSPMYATLYPSLSLSLIIKSIILFWLCFIYNANVHMNKHKICMFTGLGEKDRDKIHIYSFHFIKYTHSHTWDRVYGMSIWQWGYICKCTNKFDLLKYIFCSSIIHFL